MSEFTGGKWKVIRCAGINELDVISEEKRIICCLFGYSVSRWGEHEANARLIACAPELYEAVCDLLDYAYEALHWAGGENETRGKAPRILSEIREYQSLIDRVKGGDE